MEQKLQSHSQREKVATLDQHSLVSSPGVQALRKGDAGSLVPPCDSYGSWSLSSLDPIMYISSKADICNSVLRENNINLDIREDQTHKGGLAKGAHRES